LPPLNVHWIKNIFGLDDAVLNNGPGFFRIQIIDNPDDDLVILMVQ
jgi:hypothetical protein